MKLEHRQKLARAVQGYGGGYRTAEKTSLGPKQVWFRLIYYFGAFWRLCVRAPAARDAASAPLDGSECLPVLTPSTASKEQSQSIGRLIFTPSDDLFTPTGTCTAKYGRCEGQL